MNRLEIAGRRDRMAGLLHPWLGASAARECACDIVQVLLLGEHEVCAVAVRMLERHLPPEQVLPLACRLGQAWYGHEVVLIA